MNTIRRLLLPGPVCIDSIVALLLRQPLPFFSASEVSRGYSEEENCSTNRKHETPTQETSSGLFPGKSLAWLSYVKPANPKNKPDKPLKILFRIHKHASKVSMGSSPVSSSFTVVIVDSSSLSLTGVVIHSCHSQSSLPTAFTGMSI